MYIRNFEGNKIPPQHRYIISQKGVETGKSIAQTRDIRDNTNTDIHDSTNTISRN